MKIREADESKEKEATGIIEMRETGVSVLSPRNQSQSTKKAGEMAPSLKVLTTKPDDLSSISRAQMVEVEN